MVGEWGAEGWGWGVEGGGWGASVCFGIFAFRHRLVLGFLFFRRRLVLGFLFFRRVVRNKHRFTRGGGFALSDGLPGGVPI